MKHLLVLTKLWKFEKRMEILCQKCPFLARGWEFKNGGYNYGT